MNASGFDIRRHVDTISISINPDLAVLVSDALETYILDSDDQRLQNLSERIKEVTGSQKR